jgi:mitochondrial fission protein ELM1
VSLLRRRLHPEGLTATAAPGRVLLSRSRHAGQPCVIWRFSDGRPGHDNQSLGLVEAIGRCLAVDVHTVAVPEYAATWRDLVYGHYAVLSRLPDPWMLVGAGRRTQLPLLAARRARGGRAVVIMRPALPRALFDLCIVPEHDGLAPAPNVLVSRGSLNRMQWAAGREGAQGILLVGGPSRHTRWRAEAVAAQMLRIVQESPPLDWVLATSRRTPAGFAAEIERRVIHADARLAVLPWRAGDADNGVAEQLARSCCAWVTADSASMVYEALTAGVATGVLDVPARGNSRVVEGLRRLEAAGLVTGFRAWAAGKPLLRPDRVFDEANRCARWICARWGMPPRQA